MIRLISIGTVFLAAMTLALGQNTGLPGSPTAAKAPQTGQLEGIVVSATTGLPLHKIALRLRLLHAAPAGRAYALSRATGAVSDDSGHFGFRSLAPGKYSLWAEGTGYPPQTYGQHARYGRGKILSLGPGQDLKDVEFRLQPEVVITGRVLDEDGDPMARVPVHALVKNDVNGQVGYRADGNGETNDLGEYRLFGLHAGSHYVEVTPNRWGSQPMGPGGTTYAAEFYPGTSDVSQATPLDTHPGDEISGIDISLTPVKPATVRGQVVNQVTGQPVMGAYVNVQRGGDQVLGIQAYVTGSNTGRNGRFELNDIAPGSYTLTVQYQSDGRQLFGALNVNPEGGENLTGVELDIAPGAELRGRVAAPPDAQLHLDALTVILRPTGGSTLFGGGARVKPDGTFKLSDVAPGAYRVNVVGFPEQYYLKSATLSGAGVLAPGLTIFPAQPPGVLNLALSLDGGRISGIVMNGQKAVGDAIVVLIPDPSLRNRDDLYSTKRTDDQGRFAMIGLPPGDYKLFAWEDLNGEEYKLPDFMQLFEDRGQSVHIDAQSRQNVELKVIPADALPQ